MFTRHGRTTRTGAIAALVVITTVLAEPLRAGGVEPAPATNSWWWMLALLGVAVGWLAIHQIGKRRAPNKQPSAPPSIGGPTPRSAGGVGTTPRGSSASEIVPLETARAKQSSAAGLPPANPARQTGRIFVSYRREDSGDVAGRVYDRLVERFGKPSVFKDVDSMPLGVDFRQHLQQVVGTCDVCLAVIGADWLRAGSAGTARRLDDVKDFVRIELESALQRNIPVIPVLVRGADVPSESDLPPSLGGIAYRNGIAIRSDPDFHRDMDRLIDGIERHLTMHA